MSDYLFLANIGDGIVNSINITNFVPNRRIDSRHKIEYKIGIYTQKFNETVWRKLDEKKFVANNISVSSNDYVLDVGQLVVVIPCNVDFNLECEYKELPRPTNRKVDNSPINERSTVMYEKNGSFSSYQGEFPYQMSRIQGTFLAFDPLLNQNDSVVNKVLFVNIHSKALQNKKKCELKVYSYESKEIVGSVKYVQNSVGILDISDMKNDLVFYSKDTLGIPIFIAHTDKNILSVEHTHPPSEFFWINKIKGQQKMKQNWFSKLP